MFHTIHVTLVASVCDQSRNVKYRCVSGRVSFVFTKRSRGVSSQSRRPRARSSGRSARRNTGDSRRDSSSVSLASLARSANVSALPPVRVAACARRPWNICHYPSAISPVCRDYETPRRRVATVKGARGFVMTVAIHPRAPTSPAFARCTRWPRIATGTDGGSEHAKVSRRERVYRSADQESVHPTCVLRSSIATYRHRGEEGQAEGGRNKMRIRPAYVRPFVTFGCGIERIRARERQGEEEEE